MIPSSAPWCARLAGCCLAVGLCAAMSHAGDLTQDFGEGAVLSVKDGRKITLELRLPKGKAAAERLAAYLDAPAEAADYIDDGAASLPFRALNPATQRRVLEAVFPADYVDELGWWHVVKFGGDADGAETWWTLAEWLTGVGTNYRRLIAQPENQLLTEALEAGQTVFVPRALLQTAFREPSMRLIAEMGPAKAAPQEDAEDVEDHDHDLPEPEGDAELATAADDDDDAAAGAAPDAAELQYGKDAAGQYAAYRLKPGESLYSAVVVRFTDYRDNAEIREACEAVRVRSGIRDVTKMEAGERILIPLDMLADAYRPAGSAERREFEETRAEAQRIQTARKGAKGLDGVVIILDPGHGGRDHGAAVTAAGLYEDELTYDICLRIKKLLGAETKAKVHVTLKDPDHKGAPSAAAKFAHDTDEYLTTTPPYKNVDAKISANLRWYLANNVYRQARKQGIKDDNVLFLSMHCDMLFNQKLRGTMVYIPGAKYRRDSERPTGAVYATYAEVRAQPESKTTDAVRKRDEALSRAFAETLIKTLRTNTPAIKVHDAGDPIRNVIRQSGGRAYVPAVLRNTQVPTKVLVEAVNLVNPTDRKRVADPQWRQAFAAATVKAIKVHFGS